jgi:predicted Rossmann fold nucleotide-binding protein DprA/Smf involved in DNA uptake
VNQIAVVGSRLAPAPELRRVAAFVDKLAERYTPERLVIVSGGAFGVDKAAETRALEIGARVLSFRPTKIDAPDGAHEFWIERLVKGGPNPKRRVRSGEPGCADSA